MNDLILSLAMLGVVAMAVGAWMAWQRGDRRRALLMLIAGLVIAANVVIWTIPLPQVEEETGQVDVRL